MPGVLISEIHTLPSGRPTGRNDRSESLGAKLDAPRLNLPDQHPATVPFLTARTTRAPVVGALAGTDPIMHPATAPGRRSWHRIALRSAATRMTLSSAVRLTASAALEDGRDHFLSPLKSV